MNNRVYLYANITDEELAIVDGIAKKLGYTNRTGILTDLLYALVYGKTFRKETPEINDILVLKDEIDRLRDSFMDILDEYAFPVVAMHGADYSFKVLKEDLKAWMYQRCNVVPQESDMKEWLQIYCAINKGRIIQHRFNTMTRNYEEEHEEE